MYLRKHKIYNYFLKISFKSYKNSTEYKNLPKSTKNALNAFFVERPLPKTPVRPP